MMSGKDREPEPKNAETDAERPKKPAIANEPVREIGGPEGPEPTRFGDWERNGRCYDF